MPSKRKSVTFRDNVSMIYPRSFDGTSSPTPISTNPTDPAQPLTLDPMYLTWLRSATRAHYPFIINGMFASHIYHQNFEELFNNKNAEQLERARSRKAAVPALAEMYGSLGWGNLYRDVDSKAWVKNYRVRPPVYVLKWMIPLTVVLERRFIDSTVRTSYYSRRSQKPILKYVAQIREKKVEWGGRGLFLAVKLTDA